MRTHAVALLVVATFAAAGQAHAFDVASPNPDHDLRERSERLHTSAANARASVPRAEFGRHGSHARPSQAAAPYQDFRERVLRGHDY
ncbi:MAG: hypothetical protein K2Z80_28780 [Xanthobacteraceae bacterium]|nr:hypothetical protein [Xanthobacteraceae bacterium]